MPILIVNVVPEELKLAATLPRFLCGWWCCWELVLGGDVREARRCGRDVGLAIISSV
jgi:hypothetical protein